MSWSHQVVGTQPQSAEEGLERGGVFPAPRPRGGLGSVGLGRGGDCLRFEGPRCGALERGRVCSTAREASEGPYRGVGPWAKCAFGLFGSRGGFGAKCLIVFCVFWGVLVPRLGCAKLWYPTDLFHVLFGNPTFTSPRILLYNKLFVL